MLFWILLIAILILSVWAQYQVATSSINIHKCRIGVF